MPAQARQLSGIALSQRGQRITVWSDAPGQQEVWRYYDSGLPVLALPAHDR
jgi:hypothetical protein